MGLKAEILNLLVYTFIILEYAFIGIILYMIFSNSSNVIINEFVDVALIWLVFASISAYLSLKNARKIEKEEKANS